MRPPYIIVGLLTQTSGLGAAARACYTALDDAGMDVYGIDVTGHSIHEPEQADFTFRDGGTMTGPGTLIVHIGGGRVAPVLGLLGARLVADKHVLAHWFWELDRAPDQWRGSIGFLHGICVNSGFVANAVRQIAGPLPVHIVPYPMKPMRTGDAISIGNGKFVALTVFNMSSNFYRKNPCAVITAFRQAFGDADDSVELVVKYSNAFAWPKGERLMREAVGDAGNISLIGETLSREALDALYDRACAVVSLHRSEGLGLVVVEAMMRGIPVISTDWSSTAEFVDDSTGFPVPAKLVPVDDPQGNYTQKDALWADPDIDIAASHLRHIRANPEDAAQRSAAARLHVEETFSAENYAAAISRLSDTPEPSG